MTIYPGFLFSTTIMCIDNALDTVHSRDCVTIARPSSPDFFCRSVLSPIPLTFRYTLSNQSRQQSTMADLRQEDLKALEQTRQRLFQLTNNIASLKNDVLTANPLPQP